MTPSVPMMPVAGALEIEFQRMRYTLEFDFSAIAFFERVAGVSLTAMLRSIVRGDPMTSHLVWLLQAGLQKHHPGSDAELAQQMLNDPSVQGALELSINAAMPDAEPEGGGGKAGNAAGAPARKRTSGTTGSARRSKRGSASPSSGEPPRASSG